MSTFMKTERKINFPRRNLSFVSIKDTIHNCLFLEARFLDVPVCFAKAERFLNVLTSVK